MRAGMPAERIGMLLLRLYKRAAALGMVRQGRVPFPINQQHIADAVGLSLVHTNKTMRRLVKLGLFEIVDGWLALPQPKVLARLADFHARHADEAPAALGRLKAVALAGGNLFDELMQTVRVASLGQITEAFFEVGGRYRRTM